ncbi:hypothetical protein NDU88_006406 [Pleurodeles waltl]|uniref:Uncharacterized protein n=1 Tax=Pleurodeles waltl TaxID=8319 RepID=A0AAV7VLW8_PLEWA|nr:hypothetical protein NDU88_006406 [Pleurodeles waltl]
MGAGLHEYLSGLSVVQEASNDWSGSRSSNRSFQFQAVCSLEFQWWIKGYAGWAWLPPEGLGLRPLDMNAKGLGKKRSCFAGFPDILPDDLPLGISKQLPLGSSRCGRVPSGNPGAV